MGGGKAAVEDDGSRLVVPYFRERRVSGAINGGPSGGLFTSAVHASHGRVQRHPNSAFAVSPLLERCPVTGKSVTYSEKPFVNRVKKRQMSRVLVGSCLCWLRYVRS